MSGYAWVADCVEGRAASGFGFVVWGCHLAGTARLRLIGERHSCPRNPSPTGPRGVSARGRAGHGLARVSGDVPLSQDMYMFMSWNLPCPGRGLCSGTQGAVLEREVFQNGVCSTGWLRGRAVLEQVLVFWNAKLFQNPPCSGVGTCSGTREGVLGRGAFQNRARSRTVLRSRTVKTVLER